MYHLIAGKSLRVLDSHRERFDLACVVTGIGPGHYRVPFIESYAPSTRHNGPGRLFIDALPQKEIAALIDSGKCESMFGDRLKFDRMPSLATPKAPEDCAIHGGGETLSFTLSCARFQPLTPSPCGIRVHNRPLDELMTYLKPRLAIQQLILLTVLPGAPK